MILDKLLPTHWSVLGTRCGARLSPVQQAPEEIKERKNRWGRGVDATPLPHSFLFLRLHEPDAFLHPQVGYPPIDPAGVAVSHAAHSHPLLARLYDDDSTRILWAGYGSLAVNGVLAASKLAAGWWLSSPWLMALAGYYLALCVTRALVLRSARAAAGQHSPEACLRAGWKSYRLCGVLLLTVSLSLLGVAVLIVREGNGFRYEGYWIFAVALYDFYCLISALVFLIRFHRRRSPAILAVKQVSFAALLVSMLSLQTAMLAAFDASSPEVRSRMNLITAGAVCLLLAVLGLAMVLLARARLKNLPV